MKNYFKNILTLLSGIAVIGFSSCLKETTKPNLDPAVGTGSNAVVGLDQTDVADQNYSSFAQTSPTVVFNAYNKTVKFYPVTDTGYININVSYFGADVAPQDITLTLTVDATVLASFNNNTAYQSFYYFWGTNLTQPPSSSIWSIPTSVTIPKGSKTATAKIKLKNTIGLGNPYGIPITITGTNYGTIASNQKSAVYVFQGVNKYDGVYEVNGTFTDASSAYNGKYPKYVEFMTTDAQTVVMYDQLYAYFYYIINNISTGGATSLVSGGIGFRYNTTVDTCTGVLNGGNGSPGATYGTIVGGGPNKFSYQTVSYSSNPAFQIKYTSSAGRFTTNDSYTYVGERNDAN